MRNSQVKNPVVEDTSIQHLPMNREEDLFFPRRTLCQRWKIIRVVVAVKADVSVALQRQLRGGSFIATPQVTHGSHFEQHYRNNYEQNSNADDYNGCITQFIPLVPISRTLLNGDRFLMIFGIVNPILV
jgi:hypothetical protein